MKKMHCPNNKPRFLMNKSSCQDFFAKNQYLEKKNQGVATLSISCCLTYIITSYKATLLFTWHMDLTFWIFPKLLFKIWWSTILYCLLNSQFKFKADKVLKLLRQCEWPIHVWAYDPDQFIISCNHAHFFMVYLL